MKLCSMMGRVSGNRPARAPSFSGSRSSELDPTSPCGRQTRNKRARAEIVQRITGIQRRIIADGLGVPADDGLVDVPDRVDLTFSVCVNWSSSRRIGTGSPGRPDNWNSVPQPRRNAFSRRSRSPDWSRSPEAAARLVERHLAVPCACWQAKLDETLRSPRRCSEFWACTRRTGIPPYHSIRNSAM